VTLEWRKSSFSQGTEGSCVEVAPLNGGRAVRNSNHPDLGMVTFNDAEWDAFLKGVKAGEFD
jgi:Domain of unknown function (DUF397)